MRAEYMDMEPDWDSCKSRSCSDGGYGPASHAGRVGMIKGPFSPVAAIIL